jgi:hypothetical protein
MAFLALPLCPFLWPGAATSPPRTGRTGRRPADAATRSRRHQARPSNSDDSLLHPKTYQSLWSPGGHLSPQRHEGTCLVANYFRPWADLTGRLKARTGYAWCVHPGGCCFPGWGTTPVDGLSPHEQLRAQKGGTTMQHPAPFLAKRAERRSASSFSRPGAGGTSAPGWLWNSRSGSDGPSAPDQLCEALPWD